LNVFRIEVPSLGQRKEDIPALVQHFVRKFSLAMNKKIARIAPGVMLLLQQQDWPGNIRELENSVERAMVVSQGSELREEDFTLQAARPASSARSLEEAEKIHILRIVEECGGNQSRAAQVLDIDRVTLHNKLKKYGWSRTVPEPK
jgi:two-component system response regulator HydG